MKTELNFFTYKQQARIIELKQVVGILRLTLDYGVREYLKLKGDNTTRPRDIILKWKKESLSNDEKVKRQFTNNWKEEKYAATNT